MPETPDTYQEQSQSMGASHQGVRHAWVGQGVILLLGLVTILVAWQQTVAHMVGLWLAHDVYSHGFLVPLVSLWRAWENRAVLFLEPPKISWMGASVMVLASVLWLLATAAEASLFQHVALVTVIIGWVFLCLGGRAFGVLLFPLLFLYVAIPFGEDFIPLLQVTTAQATIGLLDIFGLDYEADGVVITLSSGMYEVARACAGVRFFITSMVMGFLLAHLVAHRLLIKLVIIVVALIIPVIANILRVTSILLIAEASDASFAKGVDHIVYGWVFLSIVLALLIAFAYVMSDKRRGGKAFDLAVLVPRFLEQEAVLKKRVILVAMLMMPLVAAGLASTLVLQSDAVFRIALAPERGCAPNCLARGIAQDRIAFSPRYAHQSSSAAQAYRLLGHRVLVTAIAYDQQVPGKRLLNASNRLVRAPYQAIRGTEQVIKIDAGDGSGVPSDFGWLESVWAGPQGQRLLVWSRYQTGAGFAFSRLDLKLAVAQSRLMGQGDSAVVYIVAAEIQNKAQASARDSARDALLRLTQEGFGLSVTRVSRK